ncbi:MAG: ABC transporter ATP-binding protein [Chitinophagales bacterium]|nr:ABC transporter ATP-binding protein [Chitinophagales bacterium]
MKPAIEVKGVWKEYRKGIDKRYKSLRDVLTTIPSWRKRQQAELFWALQDIDFTLNAGDSIGIIGRNGAGKSTLLKILSRITPPTKGEVILRGRVASLLEVGTGFHPELTGKENIYFNGSILGMHRAEIKRKFDEIVEFSGVEAFIDTPLKHYSSGMQMRLAFSVAAHLDAEILLIDEVLAVGDMAFQQKCIGKMDEVSKGEGKTVVFVSHNLSQIKQLTSGGILLDYGKQLAQDATDNIISLYHKNILKNHLYTFDKERVQAEDVLFSNCSFRNIEGQEITQVECGNPLCVLLEIENRTKALIKDALVGIVFKNLQGGSMIALSSNVHGLQLDLQAGTNTISCQIDKFPLSPGTYSYNLIITRGNHIYNWMKEAGIIQTHHGFFFESGEIPSPKLQTVLVAHNWKKL